MKKTRSKKSCDTVPLSTIIFKIEQGEVFLIEGERRVGRGTHSHPLIELCSDQMYSKGGGESQGKGRLSKLG
jgi:hypothetical protein